MKKLLLIAIILGMFGSVLFAQSFEVYNHDSELINGQNITVATTVNSPAILYYWSIKNISGSQKTLKLSMALQTTQIEGSLHSMCHPPTEANMFGGCGPMWSASTPNIILNAGETSGEGGDFRFTQGPNPGVTTILYKVYDINNTSDFVTFTISYSTTTAIDLNKVADFTVSPNPASTRFTLNSDFGSNARVEIYNVLGKLVRKVDFSNAENINIDCSNWENGYYFCRLFDGGKIKKTVKLIVTH
ncbi:MAG: T9SS type A sorting domain-containing protein [Bacteroidales bacterium]|nr:T9SS type A sorting domain-containing protein [Bacteroidales bacterium]